RNGWLNFPELKSILQTTDGNLGAHLETLAKAGYIAVEKRFEGNKPQTRVRATPAGRRAFADHVAYLRSILDSATDYSIKTLTAALRPLIEDLLSTIFFAALLAITGDVFLATGIGIGIGVLQVVVDKLRRKEIAAMQWMSLALVVVFGTLTL